MLEYDSWDAMTAGSDRRVVRKSTIVLIGAAAGFRVEAHGEAVARGRTEDVSKNLKAKNYQ